MIKPLLLVPCYLLFIIAFPSDCTHGPLAQLVEHLTFNQVVAGSIPARPTIRLV